GRAPARAQGQRSASARTLAQLSGRREPLRGAMRATTVPCMEPLELMPIPFERSWDAQIGLNYERIESHEVVASLAVRPCLLHRNGRLHGGVLTAVAEGAASMGTGAAVAADGLAAFGMSNHTSVLADVTSGCIRAVARRRTAQPDCWIWDVEAQDEEG